MWQKKLLCGSIFSVNNHSVQAAARVVAGWWPLSCHVTAVIYYAKQFMRLSPLRHQ